MKKKIIIDLDGIVFEPIDASFKKTAIAEYGRTQGHLITLAYKHGLGRHILGDKIENILFKCASNPQIRPEAIEALAALADMKDVSIEFCTQIASPRHALQLQQQYSEIAPCMATARYEFISPFESKRGYIKTSTAADKDTSNYILDTCARYLQWPAKWRITPVLVSTDQSTIAATQREACTAKIFANLACFTNYLANKR